jgi:hypothetical protein
MLGVPSGDEDMGTRSSKGIRQCPAECSGSPDNHSCLAIETKEIEKVTGWGVVRHCGGSVLMGHCVWSVALATPWEPQW